MLLRMEMPLFDASMRGGTVLRWNRQVGEPVAFGDEVCVLGMNEFAVLRRTARATKLSGRRRKALKSDLEVREGKVLVRVAITVSESGVMSRIVAPAGSSVTIGDLLAVVSTNGESASAGSEEDWASAPMMRVAVNPIHEEDRSEE